MRKKIAGAIMDHLRAGNMGHRIIVLVNNAAMKEHYIENVLGHHRGEFSAVDAEHQWTHTNGGTVRLYSLEEHPLLQRLTGPQHSMAVLDRIPPVTEGNMFVNEVRSKVQASLKLGPTPFTIEAESGYYESD